MPETERDRAKLVLDRKKRSLRWLEDNYYPEFEKAYKNYKCIADPVLGPDNKVDEEATAIKMPDTWGFIRRQVARTTAQIPNIRFRAKDRDIADLIGHTLMYQWDRGGVQRQQKKHMAQTLVFGWSIRSWYWATERYTRRRRIDPLSATISPEDLQRISDQYKIPPQYLADPSVGPSIRAKLLARKGRGRLLPLEYDYIAYRGPKCENLFIGDAYPQPEFQSLQTQRWFVAESRRSKEWIEDKMEAFPEFRKGFAELLERFPNGTQPGKYGSVEGQTLRDRMKAILKRVGDEALGTTDDYAGEYTITEQWTTGRNSDVSLVGDDDIWIGEARNPYDLDGMMPFTEQLLIDDFLAGIGDSTARVLAPLQNLHDRISAVKSDLAYDVARPLVGTTDDDLYERAPEVLKRYRGMRLFRGRPQDLWVFNEQAPANAAIITALQDESSLLRNWQAGTGESNMSMQANVDPAQNRTATGARLMAFNQDVLTKDAVDMATWTGLRSDAEMMFLLDRSEMSDVVEFDEALYSRSYSQNAAMQAEQIREKWVQAEPAMFQIDGEIVVEAGSTLADDDEGNVSKAMNVWQAALTRPDKISLDAARDDLLIALGKGKELKRYIPPPPPQPPPEFRGGVNVSGKWELMSNEERVLFTKLMTGQQPTPQDVAAAIAPKNPPQQPQLPPPEPQNPGAAALDATAGRSPFPNEVQV